MTETDRWMPSRLLRTSLTTVPFPAPEGPETTKSLPVFPAGSCSRLAMSELGEEILFLLRSETSHPARLGDVQTLHDLASSHPAYTWKRFENGRDFHLADDLVRRPIEEVAQARAAALQLLFQLCPLTSRYRCLLQSLTSLLLG